MRKLLPLLAALLPSAVLAVPQVSEQQGWSGFVAFGINYNDLRSNTIAGNGLANGGAETITDINLRPESEASFNPAFTGELAYTLPKRNQVFLGTSLEDAVTFDSAIQLGWRKQSNILGLLQAGVLLTPLTPSEVWADPYEEGVTREEVERNSLGVRFAWDYIFGIPIELIGSYRKVDVENERSGQGQPGCDAACQALLLRDGDFYDLRLSYLLRLGSRKQHILRPLLGYRSLDADGASQSFSANYAQLTYSYIHPKFILVSNGWVGAREFDADNPLYGIRQDGTSMLVDATVFYHLPFAPRRWQLFGKVLWAEVDSDVDFHYNQLDSVAIGLLYRFGNLPKPLAQ